MTTDKISFSKIYGGSELKETLNPYNIVFSDPVDLKRAVDMLGKEVVVKDAVATIQIYKR